MSRSSSNIEKYDKHVKDIEKLSNMQGISRDTWEGFEIYNRLFKDLLKKKNN